MIRPDEPLTSVTLLAQLRCPEGGALGWPRFVETYEPILLSWCRNKGMQEADAQDVAQEVLLIFARKVGRFTYDPARPFRGFLRTLMHEAWCDWAGRQRRWHRGSGDSAVLRELGTVVDRDALAARLEREFDQERLEQAMRRVRERIEPHTWDAFRLLALEGLSGEEAAGRLGMRRGSAYAARCKVQRLIRLELERMDADGSSA